MDGDEQDFRAAMSDVAPLKPVPRKLEECPAHPREPTAAELERRDAALGVGRTPAVDPNPLTLADVPPVGPRDVLAWKKDGVQHEVFQRLRGGHYAIEGTLDLHRHTVKEARVALFRFLEHAEAKSWRTLLISHGRGEQSATPARIKSYVAHWLGQLPQVIAYHSADRRRGGTGAVLVLLKKSARAKEATREQFGLKNHTPD